jgi:3-oxoacyl-[acyl-carrier protein] reductase
VTTIAVDPGEALARALFDAVDNVVVIRGDTSVDEMIWQALVALQAAHAEMADRGGRIVLVLPTIGMSGAAGLVRYTTALEGIRAMAKSAARQWGSVGLAVNMVAAPLRLFTADCDARHLTAPAVNDTGTLVRSVTETVEFLLRSDIDHLTGETIIVDGGSVMAP